jgi:hypothetical protein
MATPYERFLKDKEAEGRFDTETEFGDLRSVEDAKKVILKAVEEKTEPTKPVKTFSPPDPTSILSLYFRMGGGINQRIAAALSGTEDPLSQVRKVQKELPEKDYISGLDEVVKGIDKGLFNLQHSTANLIAAGTDLAFDTDLLSKIEKAVEVEDPGDTETLRGKVAEVLTQYGAPGSVITKIVGRLKPILKIKKAADAVKGGKLRKVSQIATRSTEGATIVGVTDFLAAEPGRNSFFFEPEKTEGLTGRDRAAAEFRNKIKYGAEGTLVGGGFPIIGKATQLGYKYGLAPFVKTSAKLGAKTINATTTRPLELLLGSKLAQPVTTNIAKGIYKTGELAVTKAIAPAIVSLIGRKGIYQLPPFEQWRLKSVTSPNVVDRSVKKLDNFLSWFRSYGKQPKDIEGVEESAQLYIKSRAKKLDKIYESLEKKSYNLAKGFESQYNTATTSKPLQKYYVDQVEEFLLDQKKLSDLPKELQTLANNLKKELINVKTEFNKSLPKGKKASELANELAKTEASNIKKYLVRSFETFRNENYVPPKEIFDEAKDYVLKKIILKSPALRESARLQNKNMPADEAYDLMSEGIVNEILRTGRTEGINPLEALRDIGTRLLRSDKYKFLQSGEELPNVIQRLLGKEKDLKASVMNTTAEMIAIMANKRASDLVAASGLRNKWLFNSYEDALAAGVTDAQRIEKVTRIGMLDSELIGKYASPEYVQAFKGEGGHLNKLMQFSLYRFLIGAKSGVQMGKTLYSPQTQVRNVTSAAFFAFMQGHIGHNASVTNAMKMTLDDIFKAGQRNIDETEFNNYVEKLVRLGVWDENVVASELKAVMDAIKKNQINTTDKLMAKLFKMAPTDKVAKLYAGGDNLWKHYGFEYGKSQLSMAFKNVDDVAEWWRHMTGQRFELINPITGLKKTFDDALDEASAYLLRNTYPTYSKVPPAIQALRMLPIGNFVSFPAEILRTGMNTMMIGLREMQHSNAAIRQMGVRRMVGAIMTSYAVGKGVTELSQVLTNTTSAQWDAYQRSAAASWNKISNLIAIQGWKNGESKAINFSYFSPYDSLFKPFEAAMSIAENQKLNPQQTEDFVMEMMFSEGGPVFNFLSPFISEPLGYDRFIDVTTRNGKKKEGGSVYTESDSLNDKFYKSFKHVLDGIQPGVFVSGGKIIDALQKDLSGGGKPVNLKDELLALLAGVRIINIDVKKDLQFGAATTNRLLRAVDEKEDFYTSKDFVNKTPSDLVNKFVDMQEEAFRIQKQMYITIKDLQLLDLTDGQILNILKQSGMNETLANNLISGIFTPVNYSKPRFERKIKEVEASMDKLSEDSSVYNYYTNRDFLFPQAKLDTVKAEYAGKYFFDETYNKETKQFEGGYYPERESYKLNENGTLKYDENGNPIPERGFVGRAIEKAVDTIKDLPSRFALPGQDLFGKAPQKPLPPTPMPNQQVIQTAAVQAPGAMNQGLTATENALLSEEEKQITLRNRGLA